MQNYIKIYRDVVDKTFCDNLVEKFESSKTQQQTWPEDKPFFTQINFSQSIEWKTESETLLNVFTDYIVKYKKDFDIKENQWPKQYSLEPIRMKRYLPNKKDNFPPHVDVTGTDNNSRFLVMFIYLSNNEKGQTVFLRQRPTKNYPTLSPCKKGNVLIFPPMWPWLHYGNFAVETPKYMVGSYLHYVD